MNTYYSIELSEYDPQKHQLPVAGEDLEAGVYARLEGDIAYEFDVKPNVLMLRMLYVQQDTAKGESVQLLTGGYTPVFPADSPVEILVRNRTKGEA